MTEAAPPIRARRLGLALAIVGLVVAAVALGLYAARRTIAREALTAWLKSKGVAAAADVQAIGPTGVTGSIVIGSPSRPDVTVEQAEIGYGLRGLSLEVRSIRLVRPVVRARLKGGELSVGALDPLIAEFRRRPPTPGGAQPRIEIERGVLLLGTDYGPLRIDAGGLIEDGRLVRLAARTGAARLRGRGFDLSLGPSALTAKGSAGRLELTLDALVNQAAAGQLTAANARLRLSAVGPYPNPKRARDGGPLVAHASLTGGRVAYAGQAVRNGVASVSITGGVRGWIPDFAFNGRAVGELRAASAKAGAGRAGPLRAAFSAEDLSWTRRGGDKVSARIAATAALRSFARDDLRLTEVSAAARGPFSLDGAGADLDLAVQALGRGAWGGLGRPTPADSQDIAAVKRAAQGFRFAAPSVRLRGADGKLHASLAEPLRLTPDGGGAVTLVQAGAGWRVTAAGGGLPKLNAEFSRVTFGDGGGTARGRIRAELSIGPIEGGVFDASGDLRLAGGGVAFAGSRCALVRAARLELGENDVEALSGRLCPAGRPLLSLGGGVWRVGGRADGVAAEIPFLQARIGRGQGALELGARGEDLSAWMQALRAAVTDAAPSSRFAPVVIAGAAGLVRGVWTGGLEVSDPAGRHLADVQLRHDGAGERGGIEIDTGQLAFTEDGLQPDAISPLAAAVGSPATGQARFTGRFAWSRQGATSDGVLEVPQLDFQSPAGRVTGLSGRIVFTSLAPLIAAPGQALQAQAIATPLGPVTDVRLAFGLDSDLLRVSGGEAAVGGGLARIESLEVPLSPGQPIRGVLILEGVQLHDLVEASPFGDRVELDARVSGRLPFTAHGQRVRVQSGSLRAVQAGRLSIQRSALTGVAAEGAIETEGAPAVVAPEATTDTFSDFAYQAMENLAFSTLTAEVNSREDGRLAVLFHIIGEHDPPQRQQIRLSLMDLIQRRFLGRKLPLPSGTGVNLTLDTTLNLDDLLSDYAEFRRLHGSAPVQP